MKLHHKCQLNVVDNSEGQVNLSNACIWFLPPVQWFYPNKGVLKTKHEENQKPKEILLGHECHNATSIQFLFFFILLGVKNTIGPPVKTSAWQRKHRTQQTSKHSNLGRALSLQILHVASVRFQMYRIPLGPSPKQIWSFCTTSPNKTTWQTTAIRGIYSNQCLATKSLGITV